MKKLIFGLIAIVFFSLSASAQTETSKGGPEGIGPRSVKGFLLLADHGCYTILINVYQEINGTTTIISSTTVCVGACGRFSPPNRSELCEDFELNGDYFYNSKFKYDYCAADLLRDRETYEKYMVAKDDILESFK
jgi:hypothetical protein